MDMLEQGKITADQAERLLTALGESEPQATTTAVSEPCQEAQGEGSGKNQYLHILVEKTDGKPDGAEKIDIRVPLGLLRAGVKLGNLLPARYRDRVRTALEKRGFRPGTHGDIWEGIVDKIADLSVDVETSGDHVRVFCD
jgi:hypothetical protein